MNVRDVLPKDAIQSIDDPTFGTTYFGNPEDDVLVVDEALLGEQHSHRVAIENFTRPRDLPKVLVVADDSCERLLNDRRVDIACLHRLSCLRWWHLRLGYD